MDKVTILDLCKSIYLLEILFLIPQNNHTSWRVYNSVVYGFRNPLQIPIWSRNFWFDNRSAKLVKLFCKNLEDHIITIFSESSLQFICFTPKVDSFFVKNYFSHQSYVIRKIFRWTNSTIFCSSWKFGPLKAILVAILSTTYYIEKVSTSFEWCYFSRYCFSRYFTILSLMLSYFMSNQEKNRC